MRIGITGHQRLEDAQGWDWAEAEMAELLTRLPGPLVGISCLAVGADSLFANLVLAGEGSVEAVIPFPGYKQNFAGRDRDMYQQLLEAASRVTLLRRGRTDEESYFEAGKMVVAEAELLFAVWDGKPARGLGGTGDVVEYALQNGKDVIHLDPVRRSVSSLKALPR